MVLLKDPVTDSYSPLPPFIKYYSDLNFSIETDDRSNVGEWMITVLGKVPEKYKRKDFQMLQSSIL